MDIEFTNVSYSNLGDALMLIAAQRALQDISAPVRFATRNVWLNPTVYRQYNLHLIRGLVFARSRTAGLAARLKEGASRAYRQSSVHPTSRERLPWLRFTDIHALLDVSGYSYGDPWNDNRASADYEIFKQAKLKGKKIILLPKTYGPFDKNKQAAHATRRIVELADLVFVRDAESRANLASIGVDASQLIDAPDYTASINGLSSRSLTNLSKKVCIIPNFRIVDKLAGSSTASYSDFLQQLVTELQQRGRESFILLHQTSLDGQLVMPLRAAMPAVDVIETHDPLEAKAIIGLSQFVVSSRFHGLINGLTQGVPSLAIGWSHKYHQLMTEYDSANLLFDYRNSNEILRIVDAIDNLAAPDAYAQHKKKITHHRSVVLNQNAEMWQMIRRNLLN